MSHIGVLYVLYECSVSVVCCVRCSCEGEGEGCQYMIFSPQDEPEIAMINVPGQRFTATHGIKAKAGDAKLFL